MGESLPVLLINKIVLNKRNLILHNPEFRLKSSDGQDRSVNTEFINSENARTIDKGNFASRFEESWRYNLNSHYNLCEM